MEKEGLKNLSWSEPRMVTTGIMFDEVGVVGAMAAELEYKLDIVGHRIIISLKDGFFDQILNRECDVPLPKGFKVDSGKEVFYEDHGFEKTIFVPGKFISKN